jgi:transcriptional regulator with XRE-family HTH domain
VVIYAILVLVGREVQRKLINVGRRIHEIREDLGVPVTTLAYKCGVAPATIYRVESGDRAPSMGLLERIAKELRTEPSELLKEPEAGRPKVSAPPSEATTGLEFEGWPFDRRAALWIETLIAQAEFVEHIISRGGYDLETIFKAEDAAVEFWGTYSRTARRSVREWCTPNQVEALNKAEAKMRKARGRAREAYISSRDAEPDRQMVDELEARRTARLKELSGRASA